MLYAVAVALTCDADRRVDDNRPQPTGRVYACMVYKTEAVACSTAAAETT